MSDEVETPAVEAAPTFELPDSPWASDLREYFGDNAEALAAADRYMRERQQPRMTELETAASSWRTLADDVRTDPQATMASLVDEVLGEDVAAKFQSLFGDAAVEEVAEAEAVGALSPDQQQLLDWAKAKKEEEEAAKLRDEGQSAYQELLGQMRAAHTDLTDEDMELIHPFMSAAGHDIEAAYAGYQGYVKAQKARWGVVDPEPAPAPAAPAVLGDQAAPAAVPPTQSQYKKWGDLDAAFDDWRNEQRAGDPPPVL